MMPCTPSRRRVAAQRGQVFVLFALASFALIGMMGLALDLGFNYAQRRSLQNTADAAVTVGLHDIFVSAQASTPGSTNSTNGDVGSLLTTNGFPLSGSTSSSWTCQFINSSNASTGDCSSSTIAGTTSGVQVNVTETYNTLVMGVIGIRTSTISATARGQIQAPDLDSGDAPIVVCGDDTALSTGGSAWMLKTNPVSNLDPPDTNSPTEYYDSGVRHPSGQGSGGGVLDPSAIGKNFVIHGPQVQTCGTQGNAFKGTNSESNTSVPNWFAYTTGTNAGPVRVRLQNGCSGQTYTIGCTLVLPVTEHYYNGTIPDPTRVENVASGYWPAGTSKYGSCNGEAIPSWTTQGNNDPICVVAWAYFTITFASANTQYATLLGPTSIQNLQAPGVTGSWQVSNGVTSALVLKLTQ